MRVVVCSIMLDTADIVREAIYYQPHNHDREEGLHVAIRYHNSPSFQKPFWDVTTVAVLFTPDAKLTGVSILLFR